GHLCFAPSGTAVYLINAARTFSTNSEQSLLGNFAGLSLESPDLEASIKFWNALDLKLKNGSADQGWLTFGQTSGLEVSLMRPLTCPHLFFNPSLTYFNGKENLTVIEKIRQAGLSFAQEITVFNEENLVDNIILRDPGGYGFFVFSD
ncbi:MAG: VOC family protein, partial [Bacteroidota bacterium]